MIWVKPGGSVVSNTPWDTITDDTLLYVYADGNWSSYPGYGSAAMRGITFEQNQLQFAKQKHG